MIKGAGFIFSILAADGAAYEKNKSGTFYRAQSNRASTRTSWMIWVAISMSSIFPAMTTRS